MPEVDLGFPRAFVELVNPDDASEVFRCDLTWLTSRWTCVFVSGCRGIDASAPHAGCCVLGAHFSDDDDVRRVTAAMQRLGPEHWELYDQGRVGGTTEADADGDVKTRVVDGACIFLNSRGFAGGQGCALHGYALAEGLPPHTVKPDVCWQLPLRRQFREVDPGDGSVYTEVSIGEYTRAGWGPGGADLDWYCSSSTEAHVGAEPVYRSSRAELTALMGEAGYAELARLCDDFVAAGTPVPHPASTHR